MSPSYLLDTSALAAFFLDDPGGSFVADCLRKGQAVICVLTVFEFQLLLKRHGAGMAERGRIWASCRAGIRLICPVDEAVVDLAVELRNQATARLPLADACVAACAAHHRLALLHCDDHFAALPASVQAIDIRSV